MKYVTNRIKVHSSSARVVARVCFIKGEDADYWFFVQIFQPSSPTLLAVNSAIDGELS